MGNMMKKFFVLLVVFGVLFSFLGCEENAPVLPSTVTFDTNGGRAVSARTVKTLETAPVTSKSGYVFAGWYLDQVMTTQASFPLTVTEDMTLYAKWIKSVYTVTFHSNGGSFVAAKETDELQTAPSTNRSGYLFEGWYMDNTLTVPAKFPLTVDKDMTLYAKWLKTESVQRYTDSSIKFLDDSMRESVYYTVTPNGFDLNTLAQKGYKMIITATYDVRYVKDYDVLLDIGYVGSPKYEVSLMDSDGLGKHQVDLGTSKNADTRTIQIQRNVIDLLNDKIILKFSTDNVQNIIHLENITVTYKCVR